MHTTTLNAVKKAGIQVAILLLAVSASLAQVNLTAAPQNANLPDGQAVPMWGLTCTAATAPNTCSAMNPNAGVGWSPVLITAPTGSTLTINLNNQLLFANGNSVPTSLVIVGQLGGGLGTDPRAGGRTDSASAFPHDQQGVTWPIQGGTDTGAGDPVFTPPTQSDRVRSFGTEVAAGSTGTLTWTNLRPGTYLIESGTHPSIQGSMGLYGMLVVTDTTTSPATAYPGVTYSGDLPLLFSEIDPLQNTAVSTAVNTAGFLATRKWNGQTGQCGDPAVHTCYPPAVNYDPRYYLVNGAPFDRANPGRSQFPVAAPAGTGLVLVRFVNAGLRTHIPSIVGAQTGLPAAPGFSLIAEDGNVLPGNNRIQSEVLMVAGKTYDVLINAPTAGAAALPFFDRQLSLSTNNTRDGGMQGYISVNGGTLPAVGVTPQAVADNYYLVSGNTLTVSDPGQGVLANDVGIYGATISGAAPAGLTAFHADGTFSYTGTTPVTFSYCGNVGTPCTTVTIGACTSSTIVNGRACLGAAPVAANDAYTSNVATRLQVAPPGILANDSDPDGHPLIVDTASISAPAGINLTVNKDGSLIAINNNPSTSNTIVSFTYRDLNSQNRPSGTATVTLTFSGRSNLAVTVQDALTPSRVITDYRWIIEEDRTFQIDPATQVQTPGVNVPSLGTNFHTSYMPVVAQGCVGPVSCEQGQTVLDTSGGHSAAACDIGNGACRTTAPAKTPTLPSDVHLDPTKRYYISVLPGDGANDVISGAGGPVPVNPSNPDGPQRQFNVSTDCDSFTPGTGTCGHGMGGSPIKPGQTAVTVNVEPTPLPTAKIAVYVFEDDWPLNGENDAGGGVDVLATQEVGLGGFEITLFDQGGGLGDSTGQITYDMFNMPVSNALAGTIDPVTRRNACPISPKAVGDQAGNIGVIVTCPHFESDNRTPSPLEGQAVIANLYPGLYEVSATPGADRISRGEEWLQTNTLDGTKPLEAFIKPGEPAYFQEFGPAGFHVSIGFANPAIINARGRRLCGNNNANCHNLVDGKVTLARISRSPDERIYSSGSYDANSFTQCYVSLGEPDDEDILFTKCDADGNFSFPNVPDGTWRITVFDQWNDLLVDGLSTPVAVGPTHRQGHMGDVAMQQWRTNVSTKTFIDSNGDGVAQDNEPGLPLVPVNIRYRDGSYSNFNNTDLAGNAGFNEIFPFFNWLVIESDSTRYKQTGVHVVYDAGGPADGAGGASSSIADHIANTTGPVDLAHGQLPSNLRVPGATYCNDADCANRSGTNPSTGRVDPPWATTEGWQGFVGATEFLEFGKKAFMAGENGGIRGHVIYYSTRPFDDPALDLQLSWTPGVPNVTVNLYQESTAPDGTKALKLVDTTKTTSWDDWAQGFRSDGVPNMNCPGQDSTSPFFYTLNGSRQFLNPGTALPNNSQFKCYDGMHAFNQVQPAPYDGMYQFPSVTGRSTTTGLPTGTNCSICVTNPSGDGTRMLPAGKYVVEVIVPPGYELVKEEDKNILVGDNYIAPVTQQFGGPGNIFILPDQASVAGSYNPNSTLNETTDLGATPRHEGDTGSVETFWPCVGQARVVPDYISLFPLTQEVAPFAGATRHLCDRKEVTLEDQMTALAKFYIFSSTHVAAHFTGIITDDFSSEFDPFSPSFGEKFAVPNLPVSIKDFNGVEVSRTYSDQWGYFNGLNYSSWEVNPPNPTGYGPTMMVTCMNDPGPVLDTRAGSPTQGQMIRDPLYNPGYSQFCYELPFMPGQTQYMDTPVVPTSAFAEAYTPPDCSYPNATPAIKRVDTSSGAGPWLPASGGTITITALGDATVPNPAYSGPSSTSSPYNQKFITRHYGFGSRPSTCPSSGNCANATVGGVQLTNVTTWTDASIVGTVPNTVPACSVQQRGTGNGGALCGELVITAANGNKSIDSVTVTLGGRAPTRIGPGPNAIQNAIDAAQPGDMVIVDAGNYDERILMWKPVRLQGVGAASVIVNADAHPSGKMTGWRAKVNCLFGVALNGGSISTTNPFDPSGTYSCSNVSGAGNGVPQVDAIPGEPVLGWDASLNGNLAELLQEPTLMGAYEGAGITVLGKGLSNPNTTNCNPENDTGCVLLTTSQCSNSLTSTSPNSRSNFNCNPSRVDGISFVNSSAGGGGIFLHGFNHNMEVSNNRVYANVGTLTGGITVGQMETPPAVLTGTQEAAFGYNQKVNVHNNMITQNASIGDELNSTTPASAGGVTFCTGADSYKFNNNWVCGNLSSGDGGGVAHNGFIYNGNISNNWILFNQSNNPTIPTNGGGLIVMGSPPDGPVCENASQDQDCPPALSDGAGPGLVIDSNLILGNTAESGSGGGIRLQSVNGTEVALNNTNPGNWYGVTLTNNIIANNVAGWDGGGVSMQDALRVSLINNTIVNNDSTATAGVLFNTLGAADANTPPPGCNPQQDPNNPQNPSCVNPVTTSTNQAAGLVTMRNTPNMVASLPGTVVCPAGNYAGTGSATNANCRSVSYPLLRNNLFWQNRPFHVTVGAPAAPPLNQQNTVTLVPTLNQGSTGQCVNGASYWDIGVRGDTGPADHSSGFTLSPSNSILTSLAGGYTGNGNIAPTAPGVVREYCNGSRVPPENGGLGYNVPAGIADATVPNPIFNLTPSATVDEGNNWVNMAYGPLSLATPDGLTVLGDYHICGASGAPSASCTAASPAVNAASSTSAPNHDFFGTTRPQSNAYDIGAVEFVGTTSGGGGGGGGGGTPTFPTLSLLDNFNRSNTTTLNNGTNWLQRVVSGSAGLRTNGNQALCLSSLCATSADAYWNSPAAGFGARQAASFIIRTTPANGHSLILKATGGLNASGLQTNFIRVRSTGSTVVVETSTDGGSTYTAQGTLNVTGGGFVAGNVMTAMVDETGAVTVWRQGTTTSTAILVGSVQLPNNALWTSGGGQIGLQLLNSQRVDDFAGGTVP